MQVSADLRGDDQDAGVALERVMDSLIGRDVVIKATLSHGITAHHHTAVLAGVQQIKRKGARHFIVPVKLTPAEKRRAEAKEADTEEQRLKQAGLVQTTGPLPTGMPRHGPRVQLEGVLTQAEVPRKFWNPDEEGTRTEWFLQLDRPAAIVIELGTINDVSQDQLIEGVTRLRLFLSLGEPLLRRNIRAAGIGPAELTSNSLDEERDPRYAPLIGRRGRLTGTLDTDDMRPGPKPARYDADWLEYDVERIEWLTPAATQ